MPAYTHKRESGKWQGMNWIRQEKRLAIYLRDGLACMYCGNGIEDNVILTIDHVKPASKGGSNRESNLITCCEKCNKSRKDRKAEVFASAVAKYVDTGLTAKDIMIDIKKHTALNLKPFMDEAKVLINRRGSAFKAVESMKQ